MADCGIDQVATTEIGVQAKIEDKKIKRRKPKSKPPWIDFRRLWKEFRKSNSTHQPRVYILRFYLPNGTVVLKGQSNSKNVGAIFCFWVDFRHIWVLTTKVI